MCTSALDQNAATEQSVMAKPSELRAMVPKEEVVGLMTETAKSQRADVQTDSNLNKALSRKKRTRLTTRKKKNTPDRAPRRPLVCIPCKKHFTRRRKLDQHSRLVHSTEVAYTCSDCHKTFSRRDNITRHMKHGNCRAHSQQPTADAELSFTSDDTQLLDDISMLHTSYHIIHKF